jgi:hypothetical protein
MSAGPPIQLTAQVRTDSPDPTDPAEVVVVKAPLPPLTPEQSNNGTLTAIPSTITPVTLLAANPIRHGFSIFNSSTAILYVKASTNGATVSSSFYTVSINPQVYYEDPYNYVGIVTGVWASANGTAYVTEYA